MRSFLECVSCWGTTTHEVSMEEVVTVAAREEEETKSLMPAGTTAASRRKTDRVRVRVGSTGSVNPQWKPSLCSITEDNIMTENRKKTPSETPPRTVDRVVKRKSSSGPGSNVHVRSYSNETGRNPVAVFLPTFSPTPFMF
ncbi:Organic cation/carnitine transporter4 isoform 1 [Hibiscus syriacus]|uniref:Organic cation/carnitine transporter4 isoform 1 n=1 Tax=Hibiscus syriacus TaxID=106335 RepID=A0A6A3AHE6_HIBSY|nr:uncharacterized protein LOC120127668 [Hibiscus syriacus]KAE8703203.1 Organic cation/carnitine transporter4 isoform 1 [Hibiscus syriacus]